MEADQIAIVARFIADHYHMREKDPCEKCKNEAEQVVLLLHGEKIADTDPDWK